MGCQCIGMGITVKVSFEEKSQQEIGKLTNIDYSEKENGPRASLIKYHNIQTCFLVYAADLR